MPASPQPLLRIEDAVYSCLLYTSSYEPITYRGEYRGVLRGLWRMEGDKMGGPFVSHALLDKKKGRVIDVYKRQP